MMLVGSALKGFGVDASDGGIGKVGDFLFDGKTWKVRWMVVDTGSWLTGRKILVHPSAIGHADYRRERIPVQLTTRQVKDSPDIRSDAPVSRQMETNLYGHYGWDPLWSGGNYFGGYASGMGGAFDPVPSRFDSGLLEAERPGPGEGDPNLRSLTEVVGYHIQAKDGPIGHVENIIIDDESWNIQYLIIDTNNWWPGQHVLMSPHAVRGISWSDRAVTLDVIRDKVKGGPVWNPVAMIDREHQDRLHGYYGWPGYGW